MPEEKKEKFTFSDKIKSSKAAKSDAKSAGNKPFAKSSSKIGKDGKPRQTIFERTRRDAPFFIAALVALLLLPFLYKYSGQSSDEELTVPVSEENIFNPDHVGLDTAFTEDPDGQIAQLSGRDSLSLIRGIGAADQDFGRDDLDFDASSSTGSDYEYNADADAEGKYAAAHRESSDMDIENNTTNIYKRRAKKATRAAFRRAPTKIGALGPASMRRVGGASLGVKTWGGSIKNAAQKVRPTAPTEAPKPVSLQPLRAKSGRSSFGGTAKAARASRDALGKADARAALRDANVKPVDPTRVGGLNLFSTGPGGGKGGLERKINIGKGEKPWWWDMMKTRMQKEWEKRFERKWKWIDWADQIAMNILKGLANCILTGNSDGDVDAFFGSGGGAGGRKAKCCGMDADAYSIEAKGFEFSESGCKSYLKSKYGEVEWKKKCNEPFWIKPIDGAGARVGFIGQRLKCLGISVGAYGSGDLGLKGASGMNCANMPDYRVVPSGQALKWNIYTYVVVRNYFPESLKAKFPGLTVHDGKQKNLLCAPGNSSLNHTKITSGAGHVNSEADSALQQVITQANATKTVPEEQQKIRTRTLEVDQEALKDACVMVVAQGNYLSYNAAKNAIIDRFKELGKGNVSDDEAVQAFNQLDLMFVGSFAAKDKLAYAQWFESGHSLKNLLPLPYWEFENAYILHKKVTHKLDGSRDNVYKKKRWRVENVDMIRGPICFYDTSLTVACEDDTEPPQATVTFKPSYKGGQAINLTEEQEHVRVTAQYKPLNGAAGAELNMHNGIEVRVDSDHALRYTLKLGDIKDAAGKATPDTSKDGFNIVWKVYRNASTQNEAHQKEDNKEISPLTATCTYNLSGDGTTTGGEEKGCKSPQESKVCCETMLEMKGYGWDPSKPEGLRCGPKDEEKCPQGKNTNATCCKEMMGENYLFDEKHDPKCYLPENIQLTRLAPVLSWVPSTGKTDCRKQAGNDVAPTEDTFAGCTSKIPGIDKNQDQKCGSQIPMMMDSEAAAKFVKDVVAAYNKNLPKGAKKLSDQFYGNTYPTDGEFVDALFIAKSVGITDVPAAAVCELGRDFVRMSRDKHTKEKPIAQPLGTSYPSDGSWKEQNNVFHNELGAFLAYVHEESLFYPQKYFGPLANQQCDFRFQVVGEPGCKPMVNWANEKCLYSSGEKCKEYHHNNYNNIVPNGAQAEKRYPESLGPIQKKAKFPLAGLVRGKSFPTIGKSNGSAKGKQYIQAISGLIREGSGFQAWQGKACEAYTGNNTLKVQDVLDYVETACAEGLDFKPYGNPGDSKGSKKAPGKSGSDTGGEGSLN